MDTQKEFLRPEQNFFYVIPIKLKMYFKIYKSPYEKELLVSIGSNTIFAKKYWISNTNPRKKY